MLDLLILAVVFMGLSALDLKLTILTLNLGGEEVNWLMRPLFGKSIYTIWAVYMGLAATVSFVFLLSGHFQLTLATILFIILVAIKAFVCIHNGVELRRQQGYTRPF